jgi:hypothetical protein
VGNLPNLSRDQWEELVERLTLHAHCKMAGLTWRGLRLSRGGSIPKGFEPEDMAQRAITAVIEGKRSCGPERTASFDAFLDFLQGVVDSHVSQLVNSAENKQSRRLTEPDENKATSAADLIYDPYPPPDKIVADREYMTRFREELLKELSGDARATDIFDCLEAGWLTKREMADYLGCPVEELYDAQKRYQRKVEKVRRKMNTGERP